MSAIREMAGTNGYVGGQLASTLISIVPFPIRENKPGLTPCLFIMEPCTDGVPVCVPITEAHHFVYIDDSRGSLRILDPSYDVAASIVSDYNTAQLEATEDARPGFFWLLGLWTPERIAADPEAMARLEEEKRLQNNWFHKLVRLGDDDWQRAHQHSGISDIQRYAARAIDPTNSKKRDWFFFVEETDVAPPAPETITCPACASELVATAIVCRFCQNILDREKYDELVFAPKPGSPVMPSVNLKNIMRQ